jgi:hypothetical protein
LHVLQKKQSRAREQRRAYWSRQLLAHVAWRRNTHASFQEQNRDYSDTLRKAFTYGALPPNKYELALYCCIILLTFLRVSRD